MTSASLLVSSPELNLEKEICNTSYLLTLKLRQNFIICAQFREEIPRMDTCYIKRNPLQLNKAEAYYPHVYASKYKKKRNFLCNCICKPGAVYGSEAILF